VSDFGFSIPMLSRSPNELSAPSPRHGMHEANSTQSTGERADANTHQRPRGPGFRAVVALRPPFRQHEFSHVEGLPVDGHNSNAGDDGDMIANAPQRISGHVESDNPTLEDMHREPAVRNDERMLQRSGTAVDLASVRLFRPHPPRTRQASSAIRPFRPHPLRARRSAETDMLDEADGSAGTPHFGTTLSLCEPDPEPERQTQVEESNRSMLSFGEELPMAVGSRGDSGEELPKLEVIRERDDAFMAAPWPPDESLRLGGSQPRRLSMRCIMRWHRPDREMP